MSRLAIGVAPGAYHTGVVVRSEGMLIRSTLLTRETPFDWWLGDVVDAVTQAREVARNLLLQLSPNVYQPGPILAVADITFSRLINGADRGEVLLAAQTLGAVVGKYGPKVARIDESEITPQTLDRYPETLTARTTGGRYLRLAWDVAGRALSVTADTAEAVS
jgi:hypothetical protein